MKRIPFLFLTAAFSLFGISLPNASHASDLSEVAFSRGLIALHFNRYQEAVVNLRLAASEDPANLRIRESLNLAVSRAAASPSAISVYEKAVRKAPQIARHHLDLAVALYLDGRIERASASIQKAERLAPDNAVIRYYRGLIRLKQGALREAMEDFLSAGSMDSRLVQAAVYHEAIALAKLGERRRAIDLFQRVIRLHPMTDFAVDASVYIRTLAGKRFYAKLSTGLQYDTNVTIEGRENTTGADLGLSDSEQFRLPLSVLMDYRLAALGKWSLWARYGLYSSFHSDADDMNVLANLGEIYGLWRESNWRIRPFYSYRSVFLERGQYSDSHALGGSIMYFGKHRLAPELFFRWQHREFHLSTTPESDPDGVTIRGEFNQYLFLQGRRGHLRAGLGLESDRTDGDNLRSRALLALAGLQLQLPWEMTFNADFEYQDRDYLHPHTVFGKKRADIRYAFYWQLSKSLGKGLFLTARIGHIRNDSNIGDYDYDRQIYSLLLSYEY